MDPIRNPYAPGAGTRPPELAGRDQILDDARVALARIRNGSSAKSQMLLGLRGVGKTVLLNTVNDLAQRDGYVTVLIEAPEDRRLPEILAPRLRKVLLRLDSVERARALTRKAIAALRNFASAFKVSVGEITFGVEPVPGLADSGDLEADLGELLVSVAEAARGAALPVALLLDEIQYLHGEDLAALIVAAHKIHQQSLPLILVGAGLPQVAALAGEAKSYAERLFAYPEVGALGHEAATDALRKPAAREDVAFEDAALEEIISRTQGYPYFLQEWGKHVWNVAPASPISILDAQKATERAITELDAGFFRVRLDRLTERQKEYLRAMAELGAGVHRSGEIADAMGVKVQSVGPIRAALVKKGMIYSPKYGETAFTVPMFDEFMRRSVPYESP